MSKFDELQAAYTRACDDSNATRKMCRDVLTEVRKDIADGWEIPTGGITPLKDAEQEGESSGLTWHGPFFENKKDASHGVAFMLHIAPTPGSPAASANEPLRLALRINAVRNGKEVILTSPIVGGQVVVLGPNDKDAIRDFADKLHSGVAKHLSGLPTGAK